MRVVRHLDEHHWREFVDNHPEGQVFHTPEMFQVFARAKGHRPTQWATTDDDGTVLALLLPVCVSLLDGPLRGLTGRAIVYGGVLHASGEKGLEALARVLESYKRQMGTPPLFTELRNLSETGPAQAVLERWGFAYHEHLNYLIDLQKPPGEILQSIGCRTRKHIRRALRQSQVTVADVKDQQQVAIVYQLLSQTYRTARVPLADRSLFDAAFEVLYPKGMIRFTLVRVGDTPAAASVELLYKDVVYGWYGGTNRAYSGYQPNELLTWNILEWGALNGYKVYDFGGAGKPDEEYGVRDFKAKFGGDLVSFGRNTCVHTPHLLQLGLWGYSAYRGLRGRLATPLATIGRRYAFGQPANGAD